MSTSATANPDLESRPIDRRGRTIYSERFIHSEIYKARADVRAIPHSHSPTVIPFGVANVPLRPIVNTAGFSRPRCRCSRCGASPGRAASW